MALGLIVGVKKDMTKESVLSFLTRNYPSLSDPSVLLATASDPGCQELAHSLSDLFNVQVQILRLWDKRQDSESSLVYEMRLNTVYCEFIHSRSLRLVLVNQAILNDVWTMIFERENSGEDPIFAGEVLEDGEVVWRPKSALFATFPRKQKPTSNIVEKTFEEVKELILAECQTIPNPSLSSKLDPNASVKRYAKKPIAEMNSALEGFKVAANSVLDKADKHTSARLEAMEKLLYRKAQEKLQSVDDTLTKEREITQGLEEAKAKLQVPLPVSEVQKRLEKLNSALAKCRSDLEELDISEPQETGFAKTAPLHILEDVKLTEDTCEIRVLNLKKSSLAGARLQITDDKGNSTLEAPTLKPGIQRIKIRLPRDVYEVKSARLVFKLQDQEISNILDIVFQDEVESQSEGESYAKAVNSRVPRREEILPLPKPVIDSKPCEVSDPISNFPASGEDEVETIELTKRETAVLEELTSFFGEATITDEFLSKFVKVIRAPGGENMDVQAVGALMTEEP